MSILCLDRSEFIIVKFFYQTILQSLILIDHFHSLSSLLNNNKKKASSIKKVTSTTLFVTYFIASRISVSSSFISIIPFVTSLSITKFFPLMVMSFVNNMVNYTINYGEYFLIERFLNNQNYVFINRRSLTVKSLLISSWLLSKSLSIILNISF